MHYTPVRGEGARVQGKLANLRATGVDYYFSLFATGILMGCTAHSVAKL